MTYKALRVVRVVVPPIPYMNFILISYRAGVVQLPALPAKVVSQPARQKVSTLPTMTKHYCLRPGCNQQTISGYCGEHKRRERPGETAAQRGYDATWRRFRLWYLAQNPLCKTCEAKTVPLFVGAKTTSFHWPMAEHSTSCQTCNHCAGAVTNARRIKRRGTERRRRHPAPRGGVPSISAFRGL